VITYFHHGTSCVKLNMNDLDKFVSTKSENLSKPETIKPILKNLSYGLNRSNYQTLSGNQNNQFKNFVKNRYRFKWLNMPHNIRQRLLMLRNCRFIVSKPIYNIRRRLLKASNGYIGLPPLPRDCIAWYSALPKNNNIVQQIFSPA
jgi:hypothetical protein